jgi:hypothetical protein
MVIDSIVMITCMSPSKPLLDFDSMQKFPPSQTCLSTNVVHAYLDEAISPSK